MPVITTVIKCAPFCYNNNRKKMGMSPILYAIHTITIGTMLNFNGDNNGHGLKNLMYKEDLDGSGSIVMPSPSTYRQTISVTLMGRCTLTVHVNKL